MKEIVLRTDERIPVPSEEDVFYLSKKAEKLASALYKVTSLLSDRDFLKWSLRKYSISLLGDVSVLKWGSNTESIKTFESLRSKIEHLISLLDVSATGGMISPMNAEILRGEYINLKDIIENFEEKDRIEIPSSKELERSYKGQERIKDNIFIKDTLKGHTSYKSHNVKMSDRKMKIRRKRSDAILDFIKENGESGVKDILNSSLFSGTCSEKTIQREVTDLVNREVLKKKGERRWSKYYI